MKYQATSTKDAGLRTRLANEAHAHDGRGADKKRKNAPKSVPYRKPKYRVSIYSLYEEE